MAMSKHCKGQYEFVQRINKLDYPSNIDRSIHDEEIEIFCKIVQSKPVSVELIKNLLGGPNMDYPCMEVSNSFECFQVLRMQLIKKLQESKKDILFFEDRITPNSNIIVCVVKKLSGSKAHPFLYALIRMTLMTEPKVGFCRLLELQVQKPKHADTLDEQCKMVTQDVFDVIYSSQKYIKEGLLKDTGVVYNLNYSGHKWKFRNGGQRRPSTLQIAKKRMFTEDKDDNLFVGKFTEDTSSSDSDEEGDSTRTYVAKVTTKKFKFAKKTQVKLNYCECGKRPSSPIEISSDEDLEHSMVELEKQISLEMNDSD